MSWKSKLKEVIENNQGKVSAKRTGFFLCILLSFILICFQGVGAFSFDVTELIYIFIILTFGLVGVTVPDDVYNKKK